MDQKNDNKAKDATSAFFQKVTGFGKKAADGIQKGVQAMSEKAHADSYERRMKKYNPLFQEELKNEDFNLPNIIEIVDDIAIREIDVCAGAIGWRDTVNDITVLHISNKHIEDIGVQFIPFAQCNDVYCVDPFNHIGYIKAQEIFKQANDEKIAELEHIAYCLGAKKCTIEIAEANEEYDHSAASLQFKFKGISAGVSDQSHFARGTKASGKTETLFPGNDQLTRPTLKWFAHNSNILNLIEMRCSEKAAIQSKSLELQGSSCASMSRQTACAVDKVIKANGAIEKASGRENSSVLLFNVEF